MKIFSASPAFAAFDRVRSADSSGDAPKRDGGGNRSREEEKREEESEADVYAAVQDFANDKAASANGLHPELDHGGPGLRVVLKDGRGAVVRQFTGEEFLRLREAAVGGRGKLLDKKF